MSTDPYPRARPNRGPPTAAVFVSSLRFDHNERIAFIKLTPTNSISPILLVLCVCKIQHSQLLPPSLPIANINTIPLTTNEPPSEPQSPRRHHPLTGKMYQSDPHGFAYPPHPRIPIIQRSSKRFAISIFTPSAKKPNARI